MKFFTYICSFLVIATNCNKVIIHPKRWGDEKELKGISHGLAKCGWERVPSLYLPMPRGSRGWDSHPQSQPHKGPRGGWNRVTRRLHPYTMPPKGVINLHCHHDPLPSSEHSSRHIYVIKTRYSSRHFSLLTLGRMHYHPHLLTMKPKLREIMNPPRSDNWAAEARLKLSSAVIFCNIFFFWKKTNEKKKQKKNPPAASQCSKKSLDWHFSFCKDLIPIHLSNFLSHLFCVLVLSPAKPRCSCCAPEITTCLAFPLVATASDKSSTSPCLFPSRLFWLPNWKCWGCFFFFFPLLIMSAHIFCMSLKAFLIS